MLRKSLPVGDAMIMVLLALAGTASRRHSDPDHARTVARPAGTGGGLRRRSLHEHTTCPVGVPGRHRGSEPPGPEPWPAHRGSHALPRWRRQAGRQGHPGSAGATIDGSVTVAVNGGSPVSIPIDLTLNPGRPPPATISACVGG